MEVARRHVGRRLRAEWKSEKVLSWAGDAEEIMRIDEMCWVSVWGGLKVELDAEGKGCGEVSLYSSMSFI